MYKKFHLVHFLCLMGIAGVGCGFGFGLGQHHANTPLEQTLGALTETREAISLTTTYYGTQGFPLPTMTYPGACIGIRAYCTEEYLRDYAVMATGFGLEATYAVRTATAEADR